MLLGPRGRALTPLVLLTMLVAVVCAAGVYTERHAVAGWLPAVVGETMMRASVLGTVLGAGLTAWLMIPLNSAHHRWRVQTSPRDPRTLPLFILPWSLLAATAVVSVTGAVGLIVGRLIAPMEWHPDAAASGSLWVLGTWSWILAALLFGAVVGVFLPYRWAPLAAAGLVYASYAFDVLGAPVSQRALLSPSGAYGWLDLFPSPTAAALRISLAVAVTAFFVMVLLRRARWATAAFIMAIATVATVDSFDDDDMRTVLPPVARCVEGSIEVCLPLPWAHGLSVYADAVESGLAEMPRALLPSRVTSDGDLAAAVPGGLQVNAPGGDVMVSALPDRTAVMNDLGEALFLQRCVEPSAAQQQLPYLWAVGHGLAPESVHNPWSTSSITLMSVADADEIRSRTARFAALSSGERRAWWDQNHEAVTSCTITEDALP